MAHLEKYDSVRLVKLESIATQLKDNEHVQNRQLQRWLTEDEFEQIDATWQEQKALREELKDKPSELRPHEEKIQKATFYSNRADSYGRKGQKQAAASCHNKCESLCEDALEILQEIVDADASLQMWFDRRLDFGHGSLIDASLGNLPVIDIHQEVFANHPDPLSFFPFRAHAHYTPEGFSEIAKAIVSGVKDKQQR